MVLLVLLDQANYHNLLELQVQQEQMEQQVTLVLQI